MSTFDDLVSKVIYEGSPITIPEKPITKPDAPPRPGPSPKPNPNPFRRIEPGKAPEIRPKNIGAKIKEIINKYTKIVS